MAESRPSGTILRRRRRWSFGNCIFDEANWTLTVAGTRVSIESKPLEVLRELLANAGNVVSKDELLDSIWPEVTVVEASLPTAIHKLRAAFGGDPGTPSIIETVPGIGYRLTIPVKVDNATGAPDAPGADPTGAPHPLAERMNQIAPPSIADRRRGATRSIPFFVLSALVVAATGLAAVKWQSWAATAPKSHFTADQRAQLTALRKLDVDAVEKLIAAGWDPDASYDKQGDAAIVMALNICEWDPAHDQRKLLLVVRTLLEGGATVDQRNIFGDTPYSVAKAKRFCGPDHPVTRMLHNMCYASASAPGDRCLATYETKAATAAGKIPSPKPPGRSDKP